MRFDSQTLLLKGEFHLLSKHMRQWHQFLVSFAAALKSGMTGWQHLLAVLEDMGFVLYSHFPGENKLLSYI